MYNILNFGVWRCEFVPDCEGDEVRSNTVELKQTSKFSYISLIISFAYSYNYIYMYNILNFGLWRCEFVPDCEGDEVCSNTVELKQTSKFSYIPWSSLSRIHIYIYMYNILNFGVWRCEFVPDCVGDEVCSNTVELKQTSKFSYISLTISFAYSYIYIYV